MAKSARVDNTRLKELKAAQAAAERKRRLTIAGGATAVVVLVVAVVIFAALNAPKGAVTSAKTSGTISDTLAKDLSSVPASAFDAVGVGTAQGSVIKAKTGDITLKDGKPRVIYVGAEFCPYCASERWSLVTALSRFGTFTGLAYGLSSANDNPANVPTLSFKDVKYTSDYLSFESYEVSDRDQKPLQTLPDDVTALQKADDPQGNIPYLSFAGKAFQSGSVYDGSVLGNNPQDTIGAQVSDPTTAIGKGVLGGANVTTARLCTLTGNKPADVCTSAGVKAAAAAAGTGQ
ncbi:MAG: DUF929 domain-containing protein [Actinomycetota bacterium]|nr:DUF929 domain-containing protein [Actinomycetota bacterium]